MRYELSWVYGNGHVPTYTRYDFTDALHEASRFQTDYQIVQSEIF